MKINKVTFLIIALYTTLMLTVIRWGIPNNYHPYNYHMDEWHQFQSVKNTFKYLTPNMEGSAHGSMFHFLLSGIYLTPFVFFKIIDPFAIKSALTNMLMQEKLFIILRLNTLLFGVTSIVMLYKISKRFLKTNSIYPVGLLVITPLFLSLSNYFKYDIALVCWIIVFIYFIFCYGEQKNLKNYILAGISCALAISTKLSAAPLLLIYVVSFFYFNIHSKKNYKELLFGILTFILFFLILGIPDVLLQKAEYKEFLFSNLIASPAQTANFNLDINPWWLYLLLKVFPFVFGYVFSAFYFISILFWINKFINIKNIFNLKYKYIFLTFFMLVMFSISIIPLKFYANGNRLLVLLPFFALLSGVFIEKLRFNVFKNHKIFFLITVFIFTFFQILQSLTAVYIKWGKDIREVSSNWIIKNIPKNELIGIENIPIYQSIPDLVLKEFYLLENNPKSKTNYRYQVIDDKTQYIPKIVIITNKELETNYFKESKKKKLLTQLIQDGYKEWIEFKPPEVLYKIMGNELGFYASGIIPVATITIFQRN